MPVKTKKKATYKRAEKASTSTSKYFTHIEPKLVLVAAWARDGLIDKDIALKLGVAYSTFRDYVKKHSALSAALKKGKEIADVEIENSLFKRATGYSCTETTKELVKDHETGISELTITKEVTKFIPPDTTAMIFWLKNRRPDLWADKSENINVDISVEEYLKKQGDDYEY